MTAAPPTDPLDSSSLGEVGWVDPTGRPRAAGVVPLLLDGLPVLALTFDQVELATELAAADVVDLLVREPRNTGSAWRPGGWHCRSRLTEDLEGETWLEQLRLQELRRYPPARRYADSLLLCREHWWYLPRLLVRLEPVDALDPPPLRRDADDLLLVTTHDGGLVVGGADSAGGTLRPTWGPRPAPGPGVVLGQDATFPDLEEWARWTRAVEVFDHEVVASEPLPEPGPPRVPGLRERWRRERHFTRACRRGLGAWVD